MWSNIKSIDTKLSDAFVYPAGITGSIKQISKRYYGFGIKSKLAKILYPFLYEEFSWVSIPFTTSGSPVAIAKAEDPNLYLDLCYVKAIDDGYSGTRIMKIQKIKLPIEIENGMNYTISGTIPPIDSIDTNLINIKLEPFKDSNISFQ